MPTQGIIFASIVIVLWIVGGYLLLDNKKLGNTTWEGSLGLSLLATSILWIILVLFGIV